MPIGDFGRTRKVALIGKLTAFCTVFLRRRQSPPTNDLSRREKLRASSARCIPSNGMEANMIFPKWLSSFVSSRPQTNRPLLFGGTGNDTVDGGVGNDLMLGNDGDDSMLGGTDNDVIIGGASNDTLLGNEGTDTLIGGAGADSLSDGSSRDVGVGGKGDVTSRGGQGTADTGDLLAADIETINESFGTKYDWEMSGMLVM